MIKKHLTTVFTTLLAGTLYAAMQSSDYPYLKELAIQSDANTQLRFGSFIADEELFTELNLQNSNLRVIDRDGAETPFLLRTKKGARNILQERSIPFKKISFNKLTDNQIEIVVQNQEEKNFTTPLQSIVLVSDIKNFEKSINIYCSDNGSDWQLIAARKPIFDYSRYIDIRNSRISLKPTTARFFKIDISNITESQESPFTQLTRETRAGQEFSNVESSTFTRTDFKINEILLYEKTTKTIKDKILKQSYTVSDFKITTNDKKSLITFSTANAPVIEITLQTDTPYYYRRFVIETSPDKKSWKYAHSGIISSINDDTPEERIIHLPSPLRALNYRITIDNSDSPALDISGVKLQGEIREIVFYCNQANSYSVIYGADESRTPIYDIGQVLSQTKSETTALYKAGEQKPNPDCTKQTRACFMLGRRTVMSIAVFFMIAVLIWLIAKTAKSIE